MPLPSDSWVVGPEFARKPRPRSEKVITDVLPQYLDRGLSLWQEPLLEAGFGSSTAGTNWSAPICLERRWGALHRAAAASGKAAKAWRTRHYTVHVASDPLGEALLASYPRSPSSSSNYVPKRLDLDVGATAWAGPAWPTSDAGSDHPRGRSRGGIMQFPAVAATSGAGSGDTSDAASTGAKASKLDSVNRSSIDSTTAEGGKVVASRLHKITKAMSHRMQDTKQDKHKTSEVLSLEDKQLFRLGGTSRPRLLERRPGAPIGTPFLAPAQSRLRQRWHAKVKHRLPLKKKDAVVSFSPSPISADSSGPLSPRCVPGDEACSSPSRSANPSRFGNIRAKSSSGEMAKSPASRSRLLGPGGQASRQSILATIASDNSGPTKVEVAKTSKLKNVKLDSTKGDRLARIDAARYMKYRGIKDGQSEAIMSHDDMELCAEAFYYYFPMNDEDSYVFDRDQIVDALGDFGVQGQTRPEKVAIHEVLSELLEDPSPRSLNDFFRITRDARFELRETWRSKLFIAWRRVDVDEVGLLHLDTVFGLLESLGVEPKGTLEKALVVNAFVHREREGTRMVSHLDLEDIVQEVRELFVRGRRQRTRNIVTKYGLVYAQAREFSSQLLEFSEVFAQFDLWSSDYIEWKHAWQILVQFGIVTQSWDQRERTEEVACDVLTQPSSHLSPEDLDEDDVDLGEEDSEAHITFSRFLELVSAIRKISVQDQTEDIQILFGQYDRDCSGELDMRETSQILIDMDMQPRSAQEQEGIAKLMDQVDVDGSGTIDCQELCGMIQRVQEKLRSIAHCAEISRGAALGFQETQIFELRSIFEALDLDNSSALEWSEVKRAIQMMHKGISLKRLRDIMDSVNADALVDTVDFNSFMDLIKRIEDDLKASGKDGLDLPVGAKVARDVRLSSACISPPSYMMTGMRCVAAFRNAALPR